VAKRTEEKAKAKRLVSIPPDVVLAPQAEAPRIPGPDRSARPGKVHELSWSDFDRMVQTLAKAVAKSRIDAVVGVAHGGVFVGGALASALQAEFFPVRISRRSRDREVASAPRVHGAMPKELKGRTVLIADDVSSSGDTLALATELAKKVGAREVKTATLLARPDGFHADFVARETDELFVFPWDYDVVVEQSFWNEVTDPGLKPLATKKKAASSKKR
jgi:hypoxanthine phosphoribosyltransferase